MKHTWLVGVLASTLMMGTLSAQKPAPHGSHW